MSTASPFSKNLNLRPSYSRSVACQFLISGRTSRSSAAIIATLTVSAIPTARHLELRHQVNNECHPELSEGSLRPLCTILKRSGTALRLPDPADNLFYQCIRVALMFGDVRGVARYITICQVFASLFQQRVAQHLDQPFLPIFDVMLQDEI